MSLINIKKNNSICTLKLWDVLFHKTFNFIPGLIWWILHFSELLVGCVPYGRNAWNEYGRKCSDLPFGRKWLLLPFGRILKRCEHENDRKSLIKKNENLHKHENGRISVFWHKVLKRLFNSKTPPQSTLLKKQKVKLTLNIKTVTFYLFKIFFVSSLKKSANLAYRIWKTWFTNGNCRFHNLSFLKDT